MPEEREEEEWSWEVFMACMFIGMGIGMFFGEAGAGTIIGMGVGFLLASLIRVRRGAVTVEIRGGTVRVPGIVPALSVGLVGVFFIGLGLWMLGLLPERLLKHLAGLLLIALGAAFILLAPRVKAS